MAEHAHVGAAAHLHAGKDRSDGGRLRPGCRGNHGSRERDEKRSAADGTTRPPPFVATGPRSQSWALDTLGIPQSEPFQPFQPSSLNAQKPVFESLMMIRPSQSRTFTPKAPCITLEPSHAGTPPKPRSCWH